MKSIVLLETTFAHFAMYWCDYAVHYEAINEFIYSLILSLNELK